MHTNNRRRYLVPTPILAIIALIAFLALVFMPPTPAHADEATPADVSATSTATDPAATDVAPAATDTATAPASEAQAPDPAPSTDATVPAADPAALASKVAPAATTYVIAIWSYDAEGVKFPQTLVAHQETTSTDVHALDASAVKCGTTYQSDLYANDRVTNALINSGHLTGAGESWPGGTYRGEFSNTFTTAACPTPTVQACTALGTVVTTGNADGSLPAPWNTSDTRATGHNVVTGAALHVYTEGSTSTDKAAGYYPVNIPLSNIGTPAITYAASTGTHPGFQLVLSSGRILVGEPDSYSDRFWSKTAQAGVPAADGYPASANLNTWLTALPSETVVYVGYSLGSGVKGDSTITSLTLGAGCNLTFAQYVAPPLVVVLPDGSQTCNSYTLPVLPEGAKYQLNADSTRPAAGTYPLADGETVTVVSHSIYGYVPVSKTYTFTGTATGACAPVVVTPPVVEPPVVIPPVVQLTTPTGSLAYTGTDSTATIALLGTGGMLVAFGLLLAAIHLVRRRKPRYSRTPTE